MPPIVWGVSNVPINNRKSKMKNSNLVKLATVGAFIGGLSAYNYSHAGCTDLTIDMLLVDINLRYGVEIVMNDGCDTSRTGRFYLARNLRHHNINLYHATENKSEYEEAKGVYDIVNRMNNDGAIFGYTAHQFCDYGTRCADKYAGYRESQSKKKKYNT